MVVEIRGNLAHRPGSLPSSPESAASTTRHVSCGANSSMKADISDVGDCQLPEFDSGLLRFLTCGSVDDGKSTLIGRLLFDSKAILADTLSAITRISQRRGMAAVDLSLLTDGLQAEREQGITIDVAYRYFTSGRRKYIGADAPGHEQYTRNMVTAASTADLAIILIDARRVVLVSAASHDARDADLPTSPTDSTSTHTGGTPRDS